MGHQELRTTNPRAPTTTSRSALALCHCILGVSLTFVSGCSGISRTSGRNEPAQTPEISRNQLSAASSQSLHQAHVQREADRELGSAAPPDIKIESRSPPRAVDAGALVIVQSIAQSIPKLGNSDANPVKISLATIRNQSRCSQAEFAAMQERFAAMLNDAAEGSSLHFVDTSEDLATHEMQGAAYLATREGFEMWEMYLSLSAVDRAYTLWEHPSAVWLLRQARPGQPQVLIERKPER